jgi:N-acetylneuraminic acid mutarotase
MRKTCLVLSLFCCFLLLLSVLGCSGDTSAGIAAAAVQKTTTTTELVQSGAWTRLGPTGNMPAARRGHSMAYDAAGRRIVLFGGWNGKDDYSDTWAYDPATNTWTDLKPAGMIPSARHDHALVYDPDRERLILFGGTSANTTFVGMNDTWTYDLRANTWEKLSPTGDLPVGRSVHSMTYDPGSKRMILFGGSAQGDYLADTWAYDPGADSWEQLSRTGDSPPGQCAGSLVYDEGLGQILLFGGWDGTYLADTWVYNPAADDWTRLRPVGDVPTGRHSFGMVYDSTVQRTILFGGWQDAALDATWSYDSDDNVWTQLEPGDAGPAPRCALAMVFDPDRDVTVLFGGFDGEAVFNDTWSYDATR